MIFFVNVSLTYRYTEIRSEMLRQRAQRRDPRSHRRTTVRSGSDVHRKKGKGKKSQHDSNISYAFISQPSIMGFDPFSFPSPPPPPQPKIFKCNCDTPHTHTLTHTHPLTLHSPPLTQYTVCRVNTRADPFPAPRGCPMQLPALLGGRYEGKLTVTHPRWLSGGYRRTC